MSYPSCLLCKLTMILRKESTKEPEAPGTNLPLHSDDHLIFLAISSRPKLNCDHLSHNLMLAQ